ncbi:hypothetical protein ALCH109712_08610 [Alkalicoccus chagannorensis]
MNIDAVRVKTFESTESQAAADALNNFLDLCEDQEIEVREIESHVLPGATPAYCYSVKYDKYTAEEKKDYALQRLQVHYQEAMKEYNL